MIQIVNLIAIKCIIYCPNTAYNERMNTLLVLKSITQTHPYLDMFWHMVHITKIFGPPTSCPTSYSDWQVKLPRLILAAYRRTPHVFYRGFFHYTACCNLVCILLFACDQARRDEGFD